MLGFLGYTLEAGIILAVLTAFYKYVCQSSSYNKWERAYLLALPALSYLLPLMKVRFYEQPRATRPADMLVDIVSRWPDSVVTLSHRRISQGLLDSIAQSQAFQIAIYIAMAAYIAGVAVKMVSFVNGLRKTIALRRGQYEMLDSGIRIYRTQIQTVAFSFFRSIFIGSRASGLSPGEMEVVMAHEKGHIKGWHSLDTIAFGILSVLQWYNPMAREASRQSRAVCENIADCSIPGGGADYSRLLLRLGIQGLGSGIRPQKSSGAMMQRIARLLSSDSQKIRRLRFIGSIPALAITIAAYLILAGMASPISSGLQFPIKGGCKVTAGFFEGQRVMDSDGILYSVSHRQMDLLADTAAVIVAPASAVVESAGKSMIAIRCGGLSIEIGEVSPEPLEPGCQVLQNQAIAKPKGSGLMYLKVYDGDKPVNPELVFEM